MKISLALAGVVLLGTSLAACGGDDGGGGGSEGDYCKELKSAQSSFAKVSGNDFEALDSAIATFHQLADEAPSDIKAEWETLDGAFVKIEKAFEDAGIKMSDLADIQAGNMPEGVDVSKLSSLTSSFSEISSEKVTKAQDVIEKHAKDTCDVELGAS
ncbi:MAG: hypothetical protein ABW075_05915 [Aeromicrobium sp.]